MTKHCPYCGVGTKKIGSKYYCPNHGIVYEEVEKELKEKPGYIN